MKLSIEACQIVQGVVHSIAAAATYSRGPAREARDALQTLLNRENAELTADEVNVLKSMITLLDNNLAEKSYTSGMSRRSLMGELSKAPDPAAQRREARKRREIDL